MGDPTVLAPTVLAPTVPAAPGLRERTLLRGGPGGMEAPAADPLARLLAALSGKSRELLAVITFSGRAAPASCCYQPEPGLGALWM